MVADAVEIVRGRRIERVPASALRLWARACQRVVVDLGAGDGRAAYRLVADALGEPLELPCYGTYGEAEPDRLFCVVGSAGTLEISVRNGSAAARLPLRTGTRLRLE